MHIALKAIIIVLLLAVVYSLYKDDDMIEKMTNTSAEAIANVASMINAEKLKVTNADITNDLTAKKIKANSADTQYIGDRHSTGRMHIAGNEKLYLLNKQGVIVGKEWGGSGSLSVQGNLDVGGRLTATGGLYEKVHILPVNAGNWLFDVSDATKRVSDAKLFKKSMPDGTLIKVLFIHPGPEPKSSFPLEIHRTYTHRGYYFCQFIKIGNYFVAFPSQTISGVYGHAPVPTLNDPNTSNDPAITADGWRGTILD